VETPKNQPSTASPSKGISSPDHDKLKMATKFIYDGYVDWKCKWDSVLKLYPTLPPECPLKNKTYVWKEALPRAIAFMADRCKISKETVFCDIGSGSHSVSIILFIFMFCLGAGNVVFQVKAQKGCICYGIEKRTDLFLLAQDIKGKIGLNVDFVNLDVLDKQVDHILNISNVIFMNNLTWDPSLLNLLLQKFSEVLEKGTIVFIIGQVKNFF
jgi:hypothetical protein